MNYSFEYIDIILLAMIAGFIFLRLRGIMGKRTGFEGKAPSQFEDVLNNSVGYESSDLHVIVHNAIMDITDEEEKELLEDDYDKLDAE